MAQGKKTEGKRRRGAPQDAGGGRLAAQARSDSTRLRAAWMYYVEQMTQSDIADALGIGRVTVVRLLADARQRHEVKIAIEGALVDTVELERGLERRFDLKRAIVAPVSAPDADVATAISAATGRYLSETVDSGMKIGVGWGRTLLGSLAFLRTRPLDELQVISLLGGIIHARRFNPTEFAWQFAQAFRGDAYLIPAPALVDSAQTRRTLIDRCGISEIFEMTDSLDMVVLSVGGLEPSTATTHLVGFLGREQFASLKDSGAVGDVLFHFIDLQGNLVDHPLNDVVMSVGLERLRRAKWRVLVSGGVDKIDALRGAVAATRPHVLITDEFSAGRLLESSD